jgi:hypothetical protein
VTFNVDGGQDDYAVTSGPVLRTDSSFAVAAWVKPTAPPTPGDTRTAPSQEGAVHSGFVLGLPNTPTGGPTPAGR